jgi:hypothetical protein
VEFASLVDISFRIRPLKFSVQYEQFIRMADLPA